MLSCQQLKLVIGKGESVLLATKGLPYDGVNLQVPGVDAGDHVGLNWRDPAQEALGGLAMAGPLDLVKGSRHRLKLSIPGELVVSDPWVLADGQVHGVAGLLGGGVKVDGGLFLAVEPEGL